MRTIYPKPDIGVDWKEYFNLLREEIGIEDSPMFMMHGGVCKVVSGVSKYAVNNGYKLGSELREGAGVGESFEYLRKEELHAICLSEAKEVTVTHKVIAEGYLEHVLGVCGGDKEPEFYGLAMALHSMLFEGVRLTEGYGALLKLDTVELITGSRYEYVVYVSVSDNNLRLVEAGDMSCFEEGLMPLPLTPECLLMVEGIEGLLSKK